MIGYSGRVVWLDSLRGFACALVILLHTSAPYLYLFEKIPFSSWLIANAVDAFTRMCVPLFFAMSGYLFFSDRTPKVKNFVKLIANILFYTFISFTYILLIKHTYPSKINFNFIEEPAFYHLWFFYALVPIYVLAFVINVRSISLRTSILAASALFLLFNPQLATLIKPIGLSFPSYFNLNGSSILYFAYAVLGASLGRATAISPERRTLSIFLASVALLVSWSIITMATYHDTVEAMKFTSYQYNYQSIPVFFATTSTIIIFKNVTLPNSYVKILSFISVNSLPIYGIHAFILDYINHFRNFNYPLIDIPMTFLAVTLISLALAQIVRLIDFGTGILAPPLAIFAETRKLTRAEKRVVRHSNGDGRS